jgi:tetratricopeptide (TPR) repeat protein
MRVAHRDPYEFGLALSAQSRHFEAIEEFERALAQRPDDTRVLFALGNTATALGLPKPAEEFFRRVLALQPRRLEALVNLANLLRAQGDLDGARRLIEPELAAGADAPELWLTMGSIHREMGNRSLAAQHYREALARDADCAAALGNLADLLADDGAIDEAMALYDRALCREPKNAQLRLNRAVLHLLGGSLSDGWRDYTARLKIPGKVPVCDHGLNSWNGANFKRTRLLVTAEQGVGDQIMFASLFGEISRRAVDGGGSVVIECEPRLASLFARSFPTATIRPAQMQTVGGVTRSHYAWLKQAGGANAAIEMGSLPRYLRKSMESFPNPHAYLVADAAEAQHWRHAFRGLGPQPTIGICWRSGKTGSGRSLQFAPLAAWAKFLRALPGTIISAQYDATGEEIAALSSMSGREIAVPPGIDQKHELDRAAAMLSVLDFVVSAPTAVSWLAAATGSRTYKILYDTSWTSFGKDYEPFAPACTCLMPKSRGDWVDVFAQAAGMTGLDDC